jgi:hypothetical protein
MSEPKGPDRIVKDVGGIGEVWVYDGEVIEDEEGMKAVMAWAAAKKAAEQAAAGDTKKNDPDRPVA